MIPSPFSSNCVMCSPFQSCVFNNVWIRLLSMMRSSDPDGAQFSTTSVLMLAALHFHPCFLTHVSTRSFVGLLRLNCSVKISNKSVVSYEHNNFKCHFMQSVFLESNVKYVKSNTYHGCVLHAFLIAFAPSACKASADWPPRCPCGFSLLGFDHSVSQGGFPRGT